MLTSGSHSIPLVDPVTRQRVSRFTVAWGYSFCFHGIAVATAVVIIQDFPSSLQVEPPVYRMEFRLTDDQSVSESVPPQEPTAFPDESTLSEQASTQLTNSASTDAPESRRPDHSSFDQPSAQHLASSPANKKETDPLPASSRRSPIESPETIGRPIESVPLVEKGRKVIDAKALQPAESSVTTDFSPMPADTRMEPVVENVPDVATPAESEVAPQAGPPPSSLDSSMPSASTQLSEQPTPQSEDSSTATSSMNPGPPSTAQQQTVAMNHPAFTPRAAAKPDYGWLMELLRQRIMSLQTYPRSASMKGWEGIVVVKTTINSDGSLAEAVVTKSSGYLALDEDALQLMHRVCPIRLPKDLGRSQMAVLIPIRYRLDGLE
jgi:protein TonB